MQVFKELNLPQQLSTSLTVVVILVIVLNELERIITDRVRDRQRQKTLLNVVYLLRQLGCVALFVLIICLNMFTYGKWV
jgi:hypothetical protein